MKTSDFGFDLPEHLIAKYPTKNRTASRLLHLDGKTGAVADHDFVDMLDMVAAGDLLIFNDTRVIPARLLGQKHSGGKVEILVERMLEDNRVLAHVKASKAPKPGTMMTMENAIEVEMLDRQGALFELKFHSELSVLECLEQHGHMPLPPYIDRPDEDDDKERYQTVYNDKPGAVAAPTAGLHFDDELLNKLKAKGVQIGFVTLHVGAGTFQPVKVDNVEEHTMHAEYAEVSPEIVEKIKATKAAGNRVIAVGTTSMRSVETAAKKGDEVGELLVPFYDDTEIFIYPGFAFKVFDAMFTNFHLPESTLMMLISAFATKEHVMNAYAHAIAQEYRFFSYGDSMFIERA